MNLLLPRWFVGPVIAATCCSLFAEFALAGDWPQILGPDRNGQAHDERLAASWPARDTGPAEGPDTVWQKGVGRGFAGVAVVKNRLVLFHRLGDDLVAEGLDADSGKA
ncbi:MAG TPA: hypothetical protein VGZ26_04385, partial [Pirellulales bacterium]|nr:hypothetical protein [Pirellulales bacterium]